MLASGGNLSPGAVTAADVIRASPRNVVLPDLLQKKLSIERWQAISLLKELADAGYGSFILGRRGGETRFEKITSSVEPASFPATGSSASEAESTSNEQVFLLMRPKPVKISVPADLTSSEADRLSKWLKAIAIE